MNACKKCDFSEFAPGLVQDVRRESPFKNLAFSQFIPTIVWTDNHFGNPGNDDLIFSSFSPTFVVGFDFNPIRVDLSFNSFAPVVVRTTNTFIYPDQNNLLFTSFAPNISQTSDTFTYPITKELVLIGFVPDIEQVGANPESFSVTTYQMSLSSSVPNISTHRERLRIRWGSASGRGSGGVSSSRPIAGISQKRAA